MREILPVQKVDVLIADFLHCKVEIVSLYLYILQGPKTKEDILNSGIIIPQELDNSLNVLFSYQLIADYSGRNKIFIYFAVDPQFSFSTMILAEVWASNADLHTINDLIKRPDLTVLNNRYEKCLMILESIQPFYKKQLPFLKEIAVVINGHKRIASYLSELLETASTDIFAVISPPHLLGEIVWQTVVEKMNKGIRYQRITTFDELVRHGYKIYKNEIQSYNETLYICKNNALPDKFYIINDITFVFFSPDRKNNDFKFEVQIIQNAGFSKRYKDVYEKIRKESVNLIDILDNISCFREHFLKNASTFLTHEEHDWLTNVFDYGVFCKHQIFPAKVYDAARAKCLHEGVITINDKKDILANYSFKEVIDYAST